MKKYCNEIIAVVGGVMLVAGIFPISSEAKIESLDGTTQLKVKLYDNTGRIIQESPLSARTFFS